MRKSLKRVALQENTMIGKRIAGNVTKTLSRRANGGENPIPTRRMTLATWLTRQAGHHPRMRAAINPFRRLALAPHGAPGPTFQGNEEVVMVTENEPMKKEWLKKIEHMIVHRGLDETIIQIAPQFPKLTELLTDTEATQRFVASKNIPLKWKKPLQSFATCSNEQLRAVGLLLYLRKAHKNNPRVQNRLMPRMS